MTTTEKSWAIGLPCVVTLTKVEGGTSHTYDVSFGIDPSEIAVAVAEAASDFDDSDELDDNERDVLEAFVDAVFAEQGRGNDLGGFTLRMTPLAYRVEVED